MSPPSFFKDAAFSHNLPCNSSLRPSLPTPPIASISSACPFSIRRLNPTTHLIRENDPYGEYPNIYVKLITVHPLPGLTKYLFILSDTGCGTEVINPDFEAASPSHGPRKWNIRTFLEFALNPGGRISCLVMTTHCHYDHILGIGFLPSTCQDSCCQRQSKPHSSQSQISVSLKTGSMSACHAIKTTATSETALQNRPRTTVLSSSHSPSFITPYSHLTANSLCPTVRRPAPHYTVGIWAHDRQRVTYIYSDDETINVPIDTGITILHTPGHTPDSLSWYDEAERCLSVGDSLYERESPDSRGEVDGEGKRGWGREPDMPTIFNNESNLADWWESLKKVVEFVNERNKEVEEIHEADDRQAGENANGEEKEDGDDEWVLVQPCQPDTPLRKQPSDKPVVTKTQINTKRKLKPRIKLSAAHVTAEVDAEDCLHDMHTFMARILRDEVPFRKLDERESGRRVGFWDDLLDDDDDLGDGRKDGKWEHTRKGRFSVRSPIWIIEDGRKKIPVMEWN